MHPALQALIQIRDKFYLPPEEFRQALHNDPDILKEEEYFYLNRLVETETQIIQSLQAWSEQWKDSTWDETELTELSALLTEIMGPLTAPAKQEIATHLRLHFAKAFIQRLPVHLKSIILLEEANKTKRSKMIPWILIITGVLSLLGSQQYLPDLLLPLGAVSLLVGTSWLFLRS
jgi:hypothetical protein